MKLVGYATFIGGFNELNLKKRFILSGSFMSHVQYIESFQRSCEFSLQQLYKVLLSYKGVRKLSIISYQALEDGHIP